MRGNVSISLTSMFGFLLVLARVAGTFVFVPLPGVKNGPDHARIVLALAVSVSLYSLWPRVEGLDQNILKLSGYLVMEAALGLTVGLAVAFVVEALQMAAQITGLQAGYGYASTIDPNTQADSGILLVIAQLTAGMLFFAMGFDRDVLRAVAASLTTYPPGQPFLTQHVATEFTRLGASMFSTGLRLALPAVALLMLVDLALALLGRLNAQLQLLTLAFPVKMLISLALLAWISVLYPRVFGGYARTVMQTTQAFVGAR